MSAKVISGESIKSGRRKPHASQDGTGRGSAAKLFQFFVEFLVGVAGVGVGVVVARTQGKQGRQGQDNSQNKTFLLHLVVLLGDGIKCKAPGSKPNLNNIQGTSLILVFDPGGFAVKLTHIV
jgi:hypothetical protein